jgi:hypothetical protein
MKRLLRFVIMLAVALGVVPFLPLYIERTMLRSWLMNPPGTRIDWGWKICSLSEYWSDYPHITREQRPAVWLAVNLALAFIYALIIALSIDQILARRKRRQERSHN